MHQLDTKQKARVQLQPEQLELLRQRTPEQVTQAPAGSDAAIFETFSATLEQLKSFVQQLGGSFLQPVFSMFSRGWSRSRSCDRSSKSGCASSSSNSSRLLLVALLLHLLLRAL
eukprot:4315798-Pyramimonas_sp.AAC.1